MTQRFYGIVWLLREVLVLVPVLPRLEGFAELMNDGWNVWLCWCIEKFKV